MAVDTSTDHYDINRSWRYNIGSGVIRASTDPEAAEIHIPDRYISSWLPGDYGQLIVSNLQFRFNPRYASSLSDNAERLYPGDYLGPYYAITKFVGVDGTTEIVNLKTGVYDEDFARFEDEVYTDYIHNNGYQLNDAYQHYLPEMCNDCIGWECGIGESSEWWIPGPDYILWNDPPPGYYNIDTPTYSFNVKGNKVGKIVTEYYIQLGEAEVSDGPIIDCNIWHRRSDLLIAVDEAELVSGVGDITITSVNSIGNDGSVYSTMTDSQGQESQGNLYTKYVYEVGSTVEIKVDAGHSGGAGWTLQIWDSQGTLRYTESISDNTENYPVSYEIPEGAFVPGSNNQWVVKLKNSLFNQAEAQIFVVDEFENMPGQTQIFTDKNRYIQWEYVDVTLEAYMNGNTQSPIESFWVVAKYSSPTSTDYALDPGYYGGAYEVPGQSGLYRIVINDAFQCRKGDEYVYIRAHAIDEDGRAGPEGEKIIFSEQEVGNYHVTVNVRDTNGVAIEQAKVKFWDAEITREVLTDHYGVANIYVPYGTYDLEVSKSGFATFNQNQNLVNHDYEIDVVLQSFTGFEFVNIIIAIAIFAIFAIAAFLFPPFKNPKIRIPLLVIGAVLAVAIWYLMGSGIL